jgi:hypothetical protein
MCIQISECSYFYFYFLKEDARSLAQPLKILVFFTNFYSF